MDEMKLKLSTKFMRNIAAKLMTRTIYKKTGCKVDIYLNELDINIIDGETRISVNAEAKLNSNEFMKIMNAIGSED